MKTIAEVHSTHIQGALVHNYRRHDDLSVIRVGVMRRPVNCTNHDVTCYGDIIHAFTQANLGETGKKSINVTAKDTEMLQRFADALLVPNYMDRLAFVAGPARVFDAVRKQENRPCFSPLSDAAPERFPLKGLPFFMSVVDHYQVQEGLESISKAWIRFDFDVRPAVDNQLYYLENFDHQVVKPAIGRFVEQAKGLAG